VETRQYTTVSINKDHRINVTQLCLPTCGKQLFQIKIKYIKTTGPFHWSLGYGVNTKLPLINGKYLMQNWKPKTRN
jgi:hypothetical protein